MPLSLLTSSRLKTARACLRLHHLRYVEGWQTTATPEARFGTLMHSALEAWWRAADGERLNAALDALAGESDPFERAKAEALVCGYDVRWGEQQLEMLAVEVEFEMPLINPATGHESKLWRLAGKIDAIARTADGRVLAVEHKTSGEDVSPGSTYWRRLTMDGQVSIYFDGARSLGYDVEGCLYDVIAKPAQRPLKATPEEARKYTKDGRLYANQRESDETPELYRARVTEAIAAAPDNFYRRSEIVRLASEMEEVRADNWQTGKLLREVERSGHAPRNPDACLRYGHICDFFDVCTGQASITDSARFTRSENPHPELAGAERSREETGHEQPAFA